MLTLRQLQRTKAKLGRYLGDKGLVMVSFGRAIGAFLLMMIVGYLAILLLLPAPNPALGGAEDASSGQSDASRLAEQAQALVAHKPATTLQ